MRKTKLHIITGILGSGKTSVLKHLLDGTAIDGRSAVVVGEFAEQGFDAEMLKPTGVEIRQIAATGIGAAARPYSEPVADLLGDGNPLAHIFLETSGVAQLDLITRDLFGDEEIRRDTVLGPTIVVLDAGAFEAHDQRFGAQLWAQVDVADVVVVNKTDKANETSLSTIRDRIKARNPAARVQFAYQGQVSRSAVLTMPEGLAPRLSDDAATEGLPADFEAFVYRSKKICYDRLVFGHKLLNPPGGRERIARFKGVLRCWDKTHCVNGMPGQLDWDATPVTGRTSIAFIGLNLAEVKDDICAMLDAELERQQDPEAV